MTANVNGTAARAEDVKAWQLHEMERALALLTEPGQVVELRILKVTGRKGRTDSGYFDDMGKLAKLARNYTGRAPGIYVTLNPVAPALLSRAANRMKEYADTTTSDTDIVSRRWLPIDLDPVRAAGISASESEHSAALERAGHIASELTAAGWPDPILADSGNGAHLLYRVELPNDDDSRQLVESCLKALAAVYNDETVTVDLTTFNASRIWKLYGSLAAKGDDTPERPHRWARLLDVPDELGIVPNELLLKLAAQAPQPQEAPQATARRNGYNGAHSGAVFNPVEFLERHRDRLNPDSPKRQGNGQTWRIDCPVNPNHKGDAWLKVFTSGAWAAGCSHNSCSWKQGDLRQLLEPDSIKSNGGAGSNGSNGSHSRNGGQPAMVGPGAVVFGAPGGDMLLSERIELDLHEWGYTFQQNELDDSVLVNGEPLNDTLAAQIRMTARDHGYGGPSPGDGLPTPPSLAAMEDTYMALARENSFHPVRRWLDSLKWDGRPHFQELARHFKDRHEPIVYPNGTMVPVFSAFMARWLYGAVARVYNIDAKLRPQNPMLVLSGAQNIGKSTFVAWLCSPLPDLFFEGAILPDNKEHLRYLSTKWIWEVSELGSTTRRADREALKAFLTMADVTFRLPYARHPVRKPALANFIGTVNPEAGILVDPTGNRRFLTVELESIARGYIDKIDVTQLWAQVVSQIKQTPDLWRLNEPEARRRDEINADNEIERPFEGLLASLFDIDPKADWWLPTTEIVNVFQEHDIHWNESRDHIILGATARAMGLERQQRRDKGVRQWGYKGIKVKP